MCNSFIQHVISLWRNTTSELWTPVLFSLLLNQPQLKLCLLSYNLLFCNLLSANNSSSRRYICNALPLEKGITPVLSTIPWITDSTTEQNIVIIAVASLL